MIIEELKAIIEFLTEERQQFETMGILYGIINKITPKYSKGNIVRNATPPNQQTYEVIKTLYDFEGEEEYCLITSDNLRFALTVRSSELERIE